MRTQPQATAPRWPLERMLFALAGTMTLLSALLAAVISPWFLLLTAFVGINQWLYVTVGGCPASLVLERVGVATRCRGDRQDLARSEGLEPQPSDP
jgi:hypothetical protein